MQSRRGRQPRRLGGLEHGASGQKWGGQWGGMEQRELIRAAVGTFPGRPGTAVDGFPRVRLTFRKGGSRHCPGALGSPEAVRGGSAGGEEPPAGHSQAGSGSLSLFS